MAVKKIIIYISIIHLIFFFLSHYALAGKTGNNPGQQEKKEPPRLTYEVDVRVTKVDVIVTGKAGKRVTGLKPENFKIYEDGILQEMTNFFEVKGMEVYAAAAGKEKGKLIVPSQPLPESVPQVRNKIIIYFDNWHLHPMNRNWSIKRLTSFIQNNFSPGRNNQGMVVSLDQKLEIMQHFTPNQRLLILAVNRVKKRTGQSLLRMKTKEDFKKEINRIVSQTPQADRYASYDSLDRAMAFAKSFADAEQNDLIFSLNSLGAFINNLTGLEGRKILIYVSDGLPINPGDEIFNFLDAAFPRKTVGIEAMNYDATRIFKELTAKCNANEITLYPINARGLESIILSADRAKGWDIHRRGSGMIKSGSRAKNEALKLMARDTGGLAILNTNNIESGLKRIGNDLRFYYTLGYKSLYREDNKYHSIGVKLTGLKGKYNVRVRQGYKQASQEEKIKESVLSRLFIHRQYNPMGVTVKIMPVEPMLISNKLRLTIKLLIPIKNLTLYPRTDDSLGKIKVYVVLKDAEGRISPCHQLSKEIKIPAQDYETALKSVYPYLVEMYVAPGHYIISLAVKDVFGNTTVYLQDEKFISHKQQ